MFEPLTWDVARFGAYMHYAVPRILNRAGRLNCLYTDFYAGSLATRLMSFIPKEYRSPIMNRALGRSAFDLPRHRVRSFPLLGIEYYWRHSLAKNWEDKSRVYLHIGRKFGERVSRESFRSASAIYAFNTAALEIFQAAKKHGQVAVLEQTIAPRSLEEQLLAEEHRLFPHWEPSRNWGLATIETIAREQAEWQLADLIICGSEFVREGIGRCGGPLEKCHVVPYGVDASFSNAPRSAHDGPLRVLSLGEAGLRKGVSYVAETARLLGSAAEFRWVGSINLFPNAREYVSSYVDLVGPVPRNQIFSHFAWADVFFLPSVCEGSATVTYEALMSGLPVITTPNAGSIVNDGLNGFIVPLRDTQAMVERLARLHGDRSLLVRMQRSARDSASMASIDAYEHRLLQVLTNNFTLDG
jgi:glycosyltransferase involved in cell wall biosynthesis